MLAYLANKDIRINALNLAGGVSCNSMFRKLMLQTASDYNVPLAVSQVALCTDNAAMIAWMGHELIRSN